MPTDKQFSNDTSPTQTENLDGGPVWLEAEALASMLDSGGIIANCLPKPEIRASQLDLVRWIVRAFNENRLLAAEAGTGVGKSFAYLLPAIVWSVHNHERVIISTATINLQQQLVNKDIPLIITALDLPVKVVLVKGRSNYICLRRLNELVKENDWFLEKIDQLDQLIAWVGNSLDGSRSDLSSPIEDKLWNRVCSEADNCLGQKCAERERCFIMRLKRQAAEAQILVVNHHLLFSDLAARLSGAGYDGTVVLPACNRIILDEAHAIADAATSFFSQSFSRLGSLKQLGQLWRQRRGFESGLLIRLAAQLIDWEDRQSTIARIADIKIALEAVDEAASQLLAAETSFRLAPGIAQTVLARLLASLQVLHNQIQYFVAAIKQLLEGLPETLPDESLVWEIKTIIRRLEITASLALQLCQYQEMPDKVCWLERRQTDSDTPNIGYYISPLDVASALRSALFQPFHCVIALSATLTVAGSFQYWLERCGAMTDNGCLTAAFASPFAYDRNVLLAIPEDAPLPDNNAYQAFVESTVKHLLEVSGGSALVLFTSYSALRLTYQAVKPTMLAAGIKLMKQGDDDRARLLNNFLEDRSSVLFGTDSFWEGVDAPGETLRLVIICRLPFRSPNEPIYEARCEAIDQRGGNSFVEISLPEAVMRFKQGFGRLVRRSTDRGAVVVLDSRIIRKAYGRIFLSSLPDTKTTFIAGSELVARVERFLDD